MRVCGCVCVCVRVCVSVVIENTWKFTSVRNLPFFRLMLLMKKIGHMKSDRQNVQSPKRRSPKRPIAETSRRRKGGRRNVLSPKCPIAERSRRRNGVAEWASPKRRRRNVLDRIIQIFRCVKTEKISKFDLRPPHPIPLTINSY